MTGAESRSTVKSYRRWWIGTAMLLAITLMLVLWPRPIRIPLKDGTTLTISAITVGTEHRKADPISWRAIQTQFARRKWGWPAQVMTTTEPRVVLWMDDPKILERRSLTLVDRNGWRWPVSLGVSTGRGSNAEFQPVETDGTALLEVHGTQGLLGTLRVPLENAVPVVTPAPIPTVPFIPIKFGEPALLPIRRTEGPLQATLRSFDLRGEEANQQFSVGRVHLDTLWNGQPITAQIAFLTITDPFGRRELLFPQLDQPFAIPLAPMGQSGTSTSGSSAVWKRRSIPTDRFG